jgi:hypothetical protein
MSTRGLYTFKDSDGSYHVYKHCDNYPTGAAIAIRTALALAWTLPRFEADEFAASFVAANKTSSGGVRLTTGLTWQEAASADIEYRYEISLGDKGDLHIVAWAVSCDWPTGKWTKQKIIMCPLSEFDKRAETYEKNQQAA